MKDTDTKHIASPANKTFSPRAQTAFSDDKSPVLRNHDTGNIDLAILSTTSHKYPSHSPTTPLPVSVPMVTEKGDIAKRHQINKTNIPWLPYHTLPCLRSGDYGKWSCSKTPQTGWNINANSPAKHTLQTRQEKCYTADDMDKCYTSDDRPDITALVDWA